MKTYTPSNSMIVCIGNSGNYCKTEDYNKLQTIARKMYDAAQHLTTDASKLRAACDEYFNYINYERSQI